MLDIVGSFISVVVEGMETDIGRMWSAKIGAVSAYKKLPGSD